MKNTLLFKLLIILVILVSCESENNDSIDTSSLTVEITELNFDSATVSWNSITGNSEVLYNVYLNESLVAELISDLSYSFVSLSENTNYTAKIEAIEASVVLESSNLIFTTLEDNNNDVAQWNQIGNDIDGLSGDTSGYSVSLSSDGSIIAISSPRVNNGWSGRVRIYKNNSGNWTQIGNDIIPPGNIGGASSISLNAVGNIIAINGIGAVSIYENISEVWTQIGNDILGDYTSNNLVSLNDNGDILAIGKSDTGNGLNLGRVRIYKNNLGVWNQIGDDITGVENGNQIGSSLSLSSNGSIVAFGGTSNGYRFIRIYENISNVWTQIGTDIASQTMGEGFGNSISINSNGNIVAIGIPGFGSGKISIYQNISNTWSQTGSIDGETSNDGIGKSVSLNSDGDIVAFGGTAFTGTSGFVRVFKNNSNVWSQVGNDLIGEAIGDGSGNWPNTVSLNSDGSIVAIGAPNNDGNGNSSGHVRVYNGSSLLNN